MPDQVVWILSRQAALAIALGVIVWGFVDVHSAVSVLIGGSIGVIANLGYVLRAMRLTSGSDPVKLYRAQAAGEGFKFLLTLAGFALVFWGTGKWRFCRCFSVTHQPSSSTGWHC